MTELERRYRQLLWPIRGTPVAVPIGTGLAVSLRVLGVPGVVSTVVAATWLVAVAVLAAAPARLGWATGAGVRPIVTPLGGGGLHVVVTPGVYLMELVCAVLALLAAATVHRGPSIVERTGVGVAAAAVIAASGVIVIGAVLLVLVCLATRRLRMTPVGQGGQRPGGEPSTVD